jgi:hypothetical protein
MCDSRFQFAYLIKYTCGTEEKNEAKLLQTTQKDTVEVVEEDHKNLKISSQKFLDQQRKKKNPGQLIREVSQTEMDWNLLGLPYVYTTCTYIHLSTHEAADRCTILKTQRKRGRRLDRTHDPRAIDCRSDFRDNGLACRTFTDNQETLIRDYNTSQYALDRVHAFNVRPPELMAFDQLVSYTKWFQPVTFQKRTMEFKLPEELAECPLIDGAFRQVKFVSSTLQEVHDYLVEADRKMQAREEAGQQASADSYLPPSVRISWESLSIFHLLCVQLA